MESLSRYQGCLLGLAAGDALGTTLEFLPPGSFEPLTDMVGGGPFMLEAGQWTDDTSMALCLAESLITCGGFEPDDQMERYGRWVREGYLSSNGICFDVGGTVMDSLCRYSFGSNPFVGPAEEDRAGNGCIMRLAPVPLAYAQMPEVALGYSVLSAMTTHRAPACIDCTHLMTCILLEALSGESKEALLRQRETGYHPLVKEIAEGRFLNRQPPEIKGTGFVVRALEAALWAFAGSESFEEGALKAVNLGHDADTTGAIYGQIAGAYYGVEGIPVSWRAKIAMHELIMTRSEELLILSGEMAADHEAVLLERWQKTASEVPDATSPFS